MYHEHKQQLAEVQKHIIHGNYHEAKKIIFQVIDELAAQPEDRDLARLRSQAYLNLANVEIYLGQTASAQEWTQKALALAESYSLDSQKPDALYALAYINEISGEFQLALQQYFEAKEIYQHRNDLVGVARTLEVIGIVKQSTGYTTESLEHYKQSLEIYESIGNDEGIASTNNNIGSVYMAMGNNNLSIEYFQKSEMLFSGLGDKHNLSNVLSNIGLSYLYMGKIDTALEYFQKRLALSEQIDNKMDIGSSLKEIANLFLEIDDLHRALEYLEHSAIIFEGIGYLKGICECNHYISIIHAKQGHYEEALEKCFSLIESYTNMGDKSGLANASLQIADIYREIKSFDKAMQYYAQAGSLFAEMQDTDNVAIAEGNIASLLIDDENSTYNSDEVEQRLLLTNRILQSNNKEINRVKVLNSLIKLYKKKKRWEDCLIVTEEYFQLKEKIGGYQSQNAANRYALDRNIALIEKEKEVTDLLLQKTFPVAVIPALKSGNDLLMEEFPSASVLFADLVGFTPLSLTIAPSVLVKLLNGIFTQFDTIMLRHDCERLKTIGDGYMAVCGVPIPVDDHAYRLASAAIDILQEFDPLRNMEAELPQGTNISIRIGLHCGPLVAGIVGGLEKWQYDIYGDTVNTASRMESHGKPEKIHCSEEFRNALLDYQEFEFTKLPPLTVKGKGTMQTFFLDKKQ